MSELSRKISLLSKYLGSDITAKDAKNDQGKCSGFWHPSKVVTSLRKGK